MKFTLGEIARMIGAQLAGGEGAAAAVAAGYSIDSRSLQPGELFFAVRGESRDGHEFVAAAMGAGAAGAVVEREPERPDGRFLVVKDARAALQQLATCARRQWGRPLVAITGSNGKTTTKEITAALLGTRLRVAKTEGNLNNDLGLPLSLLRIDEQAEVAVMELGMNHAGEIRALAAIAEPQVGVVTNVSAAHLEFFHSVEEIALAKRELIESLPAGGTAVLNADDERVSRFAGAHPGRVVTFGIEHAAEVRAASVEDLGAEGTRFRLEASGTTFRLALPGRHNLYNTLAALAVARLFEIPAESLRDAVAALAPVRMRGELLEVRGIRILNDCYNSNPRAAEMMLSVLAATPARRRVAVLGEMRELGGSSEDLHRQVGRRAAAANLGLLIGVGGAARALVDAAVEAGFPATAAFFFEDAVSAGAFLKTALEGGDAVLLKGSRAVKLERAVEAVLGRG